MISRIQARRNGLEICKRTPENANNLALTGYNGSVSARQEWKSETHEVMQAMWKRNGGTVKQLRAKDKWLRQWECVMTSWVLNDVKLAELIVGVRNDVILFSPIRTRDNSVCQL